MKQIKKDIYNLLIQVIILGALVAVGCAMKFTIVLIVTIVIMSLVDIICLWLLIGRINSQAKLNAINEETLRNIKLKLLQTGVLDAKGFN